MPARILEVCACTVPTAEEAGMSCVCTSLQVLKVRGDGLGTPDRSLLLPKLRLNEEELARQRIQGRRLPSASPTSTNQISFYADDPFHVPFRCMKCRGSIMVV